MDILKVKQNGEWVGIPAIKGDKGEKGDTGEQGQNGADGFSPTASVSKSGSAATITITDKNGTTSATVSDGAALIDDTAGAGDTDKAWSADKTAGEVGKVFGAISQKYEKPSGGIPASDLASGVIPAVPVQDVQVNRTSILSQGVANVPIASSDPGVVKIDNQYGVGIDANGRLIVNYASASNIKSGTVTYKPVTPTNQHNSVFYGLAKCAGDNTQSSSSNAVGNYTESAKSAISQMLDAPETVSGTTPSITAKPGVRYVCGECATLTITAPASGCIDVTFTSGATPTVLTVTPPTGVTAVKWANGFDPTSLDTNTTYEVNILDGELGVVGSWT